MHVPPCGRKLNKSISYRYIGQLWYDRTRKVFQISWNYNEACGKWTILEICQVHVYLPNFESRSLGSIMATNVIWNKMHVPPCGRKLNKSISYRYWSIVIRGRFSKLVETIAKHVESEQFWKSVKYTCTYQISSRETFASVGLTQTTLLSLFLSYHTWSELSYSE